MKAALTRFLLICSIVITGYTSNAQLRKGHFVIEGYYGFPNFGLINAQLIRLAVKPIIEENVPNLSESVGVTLSGFGPAGGRMEYMVRNRIGLGVDFIYNSTSANFAIDSFNIDSTYFGQVGVGYKMTRIRVHFRFNYHFCNTKRWDIYCGAGVGYNTRSHRFSASLSLLQDWNFAKAFSFSYPYSARTSIGFRFYPVRMIGIGMELGLGGPLVSGSISTRFNLKKEEKPESTFE